MSPYLELTEFSEIVNKLAIKSNDSGFEVRCIMPRFGIINERRHRLHEVVRLSGINVSVDNDDFPLTDQSSFTSQCGYRFISWTMKICLKGNIFLLMKMKNGMRTMIFERFSFVKGLETVKKFGWPPDIIHCSGWMTGLIPAVSKNRL